MPQVEDQHRPQRMHFVLPLVNMSVDQALYGVIAEDARRFDAVAGQRLLD